MIKGDRLLIIVDHHLEEIAPLISRMIEVDREGKIFERDVRVSKAKNNPTFKIPLISQSENLSMQLREVSFYYNQNTTLLNTIHTTFKGGEVCAIKGANGVGKSTLFKLLSGVMAPTSGSIQTLIGSKEFRNKKNFINVGYVFQNPENHFFFDTIEEELKQSFKNIIFCLLLKIFQTFFIFVKPALFSRFINSQPSNKSKRFRS